MEWVLVAFFLGGWMGEWVWFGPFGESLLEFVFSLI